LLRGGRRRLEPAGFIVEESEVVVHEGDEPDLLVDLLDADLPSGEDGAEAHFVANEADSAAAGDGDVAIVEGVVEFLEPAIGSRRGGAGFGRMAD